MLYCRPRPNTVCIAIASAQCCQIKHFWWHFFAAVFFMLGAGTNIVISAITNIAHTQRCTRLRSAAILNSNQIAIKTFSLSKRQNRISTVGSPSTETTTTTTSVAARSLPLLLYSDMSMCVYICVCIFINRLPFFFCGGGFCLNAYT